MLAGCCCPPFLVAEGLSSLFGAPALWGLLSGVGATCCPLHVASAQHGRLPLQAIPGLQICSVPPTKVSL